MYIRGHIHSSMVRGGHVYSSMRSEDTHIAAYGTSAVYEALSYLRTVGIFCNAMPYMYISSAMLCCTCSSGCSQCYDICRYERSLLQPDLYRGIRSLTCGAHVVSYTDTHIAAWSGAKKGKAKAKHLLCMPRFVFLKLGLKLSANCRPTSRNDGWRGIL